MARRARPLAVALALGALAAAACSSPKPRPLAFGTEQCARCHMTLADPRFAAQLVTSTGKVVPFDDVGCLAEYVVFEREQMGTVHSLWVQDFAEPAVRLEAREAVYLLNDSVRTPMDHRVVALRRGPQADSVLAALGGRLVSWDAVVARARSGGPVGQGGPVPGAKPGSRGG